MAAEDNVILMVLQTTRRTENGALGLEAVSKMGGIDILILNHILPIPLGIWEGSPQNLIITDNSSHFARSTSSGRLQWQHHCGILSGRSGEIGQSFTAVYSALDGFFGGLRQEFRMKGCGVSITLCVIGLVGTENDIKDLKDYGQHYLLEMLPAEENCFAV